jgi:hypothetical protein
MTSFPQSYRDGVRRAWPGAKGVPKPDEDVWERVRSVELRIEPGLTSPDPDVFIAHANEEDLLEDGKPMAALTRLVRRALQRPPGRPHTPWVDLTDGGAEWELNKVNDPHIPHTAAAVRIITKMTNWWCLEVTGLPGTGLEETRYLAGDLEDPDWKAVLEAIAPRVRAKTKRGLVVATAPGLQ